MTPLIQGMLSSALMGGIRGLAKGGQQGGVPSIPGYANGGMMGGITGLPEMPPIPPGETPQMAYAMDKGGMIRGPGGGVDDLIGGTIDNRNKVLLSDGEFVVPARVVSALGDGSSEAGAKVLHEMISRVKGQAEDRLKDNGNINLSGVLPA